MSNTPAPEAQHTRTWNTRALLEWSQGYFAGKGLPTPRLDAEWLLAHVLGQKRMELYLNFDRPASPGELAAFKALVTRRVGREPLAYIIGHTGFWTFDLAVAPGVLIPRPETEMLVEVALEGLAQWRVRLGAEAPLAVLELGTGTWAIPLALCSESQHLDVLSVDASPVALAVAQTNAQANARFLAPRHNRLRLARMDRFSALAPGFAPQVLVSNPPYIPSAVIPTLEPEVAQAEPRLALDGGADGLDYYRYLVAWAAGHLAPGGFGALEIGDDQGGALEALVRAQPRLEWAGIKPDLAQRDRVASFWKRG